MTRGIASPKCVSPCGYDPAWFEVLSEVEERHFWFCARKRIITTAVQQTMSALGPRPRLLEVGCGNGNVLRALEALFPEAIVVGMDLFEECLEHARARCNCGLVAGDILNAPFADGSFDLIGMFDVLEHLADDLRALRALHSLLAPGGAVVLTVPASRALWSSFDQAAGHFRRYEAQDLAARIVASGFKVTYATSFMMTIYPLVWASRRCAKLRGRLVKRDAPPFSTASAELKVRPILNGLLSFLLRWEQLWIARRGTLPAGTSLLVVARKAAGLHQ